MEQVVAHSRREKRLRSSFLRVLVPGYVVYVVVQISPTHPPESPDGPAYSTYLYVQVQVSKQSLNVSVRSFDCMGLND
jgi:hypothetical protein